MGMKDKLQGKAHELGGKMTDDKKLEMKGKAEQSMGEAKDKLQDAKDRMHPKM